MCVCRTRQKRPGGARSRSQHGEEVQRAVEVARAQGEVADGDRRREAVVERLREPQRLVDAVPAEPLDRDLVRAQLARVEQAEQLDRAEVALAQRAVLLGAVLADVPRDCPSAPRPPAPASARWASRRRRRRPGRSAPAAARAPRRGPGRARSSAGTRRSRRRPPTARACCARSAASGPSTSAGRARRPRGWRRPPRRRPPSGRAPPSRSPRRRRGRPRAGRRPARRSTR